MTKIQEIKSVFGVLWGSLHGTTNLQAVTKCSKLLSELEEELKHSPRCPECEKRQRRGICMESHFNKHGVVGDELNGDD